MPLMGPTSSSTRKSLFFVAKSSKINKFICIFPNKISKTAQNTLETPMVRDMEDWDFPIKLRNILKILVKWTRPVKTGALYVAGAWI